MSCEDVHMSSWRKKSLGSHSNWGHWQYITIAPERIQLILLMDPIRISSILRKSTPLWPQTSAIENSTSRGERAAEGSRKEQTMTPNYPSDIKYSTQSEGGSNKPAELWTNGGRALQEVMENLAWQMWEDLFYSKYSLSHTLSVKRAPTAKALGLISLRCMNSIYPWIAGS